MPRPLQLLGVFAVCASTAFAAPTELDPPAAEQGPEATTIIQIEVTAGTSGAPNGFTIEWISRTLFDQLGGWPADPLDPRIHAAIYLGIPSLNTAEGTTSFLLGPGQSATVEVGDLFDETGVLATSAGELAVGTEYAVRVRANGEGGMTGGGGGLLPPSPNSETQFFRTRSNDGLRDCVRSQGYWKTHPTVWPVSSLRLGSIIYTKNQLLAIWSTPAAGNGLISLAHQLMAAKLNVISGAVAPASVTDDIAAADALIGTRIVPPVGSGHLSPGSTSALTDDLEEFNTEEGGDVECHVITPARPSTWGRVKSLYR
jgi:hypothetical protein